jgi:hypothetical protein
MNKAGATPALSLKNNFYFDAAFLCAAQRLLTASAMRLRPSGVSLRFLR